MKDDSENFDESEFFKKEIEPLLDEARKKMNSKDIPFLLCVNTQREDDGFMFVTSCYNSGKRYCEPLNEAIEALIPRQHNENKIKHLRSILAEAIKAAREAIDNDINDNSDKTSH